MACRLSGDEPLPELMLTYCKLDSRGTNFSKIWTNYIFILDLTPGINGLGKENYKTNEMVG